MTRAAQKLLDDFGSLSDEERAEVTAEVVRRLAFHRAACIRSPH
jgi:hypothetical protein